MGKAIIEVEHSSMSNLTLWNWLMQNINIEHKMLKLSGHCTVRISNKPYSCPGCKTSSCEKCALIKNGDA